MKSKELVSKMHVSKVSVNRKGRPLRRGKNNKASV